MMYKQAAIISLLALFAQSTLAKKEEELQEQEN